MFLTQSIPFCVMGTDSRNNEHVAVVQEGNKLVYGLHGHEPFRSGKW